MGGTITDWVLGRKLANREVEGERLGVFAGVPAMGLDGLGSAAYGPEAALAVLVVAGTAGSAAVVPITAVVLVLLAILYFSYRQTVAAYPNNGGSYVVARENLGAGAGVLAAASLMVDYMLNVAVGISAGVGALTSALPVLQPWTLPLCLAILVLLTVVNLRGTKESGLAFGLPTYLFVASLFLALGLGIWRASQGGAPVVAPAAPMQAAAGTVGLWLLMRAFASGCTAMTGVEAVSNGVSAFREPRVANAHRTLTAIVVTLGILLAGIAVLARHWDVGAMDQTKDGYRSVLAQVVAAAVGQGPLFWVAIASTVAVLSLSANTSFVGFPRLCRMVAEDGYLPRAFAIPGRRLVYSAGVLFLAGGSGALLTAFGGITDRLIPLFAVGAFASFTLSQAGMAKHWLREDGPRRHVGPLVINATGAVATGVALAVILVAKFAEGAWLTLLVIPATFLALRSIRRYYDALADRVLRGADRMLDLSGETRPPLVLLPLGQWDRMAAHAVTVALRMSPDVTALHVTETEGPDFDAAQQEELCRRLQSDFSRWVAEPARAAGLPAPTLRIEPSPYRSVLGPLLRQVLAWRTEQPGRAVAVVLPMLVEARWWETLLHTHAERRLRQALLRDGGPDVSVVSVPWLLRPPETQAAIAAEEPAVEGPPHAA